MKTMAEVIREADEQWNRDVQVVYTDAAWAEYIAAALTAAGYGPVKEAAAEALRDAAEDIDLPGSTAAGYYASEQDSGYREAERHAETWLRSRAAAIEAEP